MPQALYAPLPEAIDAYCREDGSWIDAYSADQMRAYADATCSLRGADEARQFPDNTCGASRHAQMIGETLVKGEAFPQLSEEPVHCGQSILATVEALYRARTALRGGQQGWRPVPEWVYDLILSGDLEPVLMRAGDEATRLRLYRARQEMLASPPPSTHPQETQP